MLLGIINSISSTHCLLSGGGGGVSAPVNSVLPAVTGTTTAESTMSTTNGTWSGSPTFAYQWKRDATNIGTNASIYTLVEDDVTTAITCVVTATNAGGSTAATSNSTNIPAKAVPTFVAKITRATTVSSTITLAIPAGTVANDIMLMYLETANQSVATPTDWTQIAMQGGGTAGAVGSIGVQLFWKLASGSDTSRIITNPGDHITGQILTFRGCPISGNPWSAFTEGTQLTATTTFSAGGPTTVVHNELVVILACTGADSATAKFTTANNMAGTGLTNIVNQEDTSLSGGNGGGLAAWTATKADTGAMTSVTATINSASEYAYIIISLKPV